MSCALETPLKPLPNLIRLLRPPDGCLASSGRLDCLLGLLRTEVVSDAAARSGRPGHSMRGRSAVGTSRAAESGMPCKARQKGLRNYSEGSE